MSNENPSLETRFKPGESGNPKGRPKGRFSITSQIIDYLKNNPHKNEEIISWLLNNRKDLVWQMIDPKPPQDLNVGGQAENPIRIIEVEIEDEDKVVPQARSGV